MCQFLVLLRILHQASGTLETSLHLSYVDDEDDGHRVSHLELSLN